MVISNVLGEGYKWPLRSWPAGIVSDSCNDQLPVGLIARLKYSTATSLGDQYVFSCHERPSIDRHLADTFLISAGSNWRPTIQGHPTDRFGKLFARKALNPLTIFLREFSP